MTRIREFDTHPDGSPPIEHELSDTVAGMGVTTPVVVLMRAGNDLAIALDCGGYSEQIIQQLVQGWESALFAAARDFDRQPDGRWDGRA